MRLHLQSFQEELGQLRAAPGSALHFPGRGNAVVAVPVGSGRSSPSHPMLEEDAAPRLGNASLELCIPTGFLPPLCPPWTLGMGGNAGAGRACSAIDCPVAMGW